jgi:MYXO-CTERM domain-containing protein
MMNTKTLLAAFAATAMTAAASAGTTPVSIVSGATHGNVDLTVTVQASSQAGYYDFVVSNASGTPGASVTGIYFESGWASLISGGAFSGSGSLNSGSSSPSIAGWTGSAASYTVGTTTTPIYQFVNRRGMVLVGTETVENIDGGIQEGSSGIVSFASSASLGDLEAALGGSGFNVGVKIQDVISDKSAAGWGLAQAFPQQQPIEVVDGPTQDGGQGGYDVVKATSAPTPTAALAGLALMGLAGMRRRRA